MNPDSIAGFTAIEPPANRVSDPLQRPAIEGFEPRSRANCYSAALTTDRALLPRPDDNMKSEMRGTISARKREPLKTP